MSGRLRVVLVGCGGISGAWMGTAAMRDAVDLVGVVDLDLSAAHRFVARHALGPVPVGSDLTAMIATGEPEAVFDLTVPDAHETVTTTALQAGCHVLGEKPMAPSLEAGRRMVAAANDAGRIYAVTQTRRFMPRQQALAAWLQEGHLGRLREVHVDFRIAAHFGGFREQMDHVLLLDMAIHHFDQIRAVIGGQARRVACREWNPPGSNYRHGAAAQAWFEMNDGCVVTYRGSWTASGMQTSWNGDWLIEGTRGSLRWDGEQGFRAERLVDPSQPGARDGGPLIRDLEPITLPDFAAAPGRSGHDGAIADFIAALRHGHLPQAHAGDNLHSLAMVHGAVAAAEDGGVIEVGSAVGLLPV